MNVENMKGSYIMKSKYKYMSNWSGELQPTLLKVIKETINSMKNYPFEWSMLCWQYNKNGW